MTTNMVSLVALVAGFVLAVSAPLWALHYVLRMQRSINTSVSLVAFVLVLAFAELALLMCAVIAFMNSGTPLGLLLLAGGLVALVFVLQGKVSLFRAYGLVHGHALVDPEDFAHLLRILSEARQAATLGFSESFVLVRVFQTSDTQAEPVLSVMRKYRETSDPRLHVNNLRFHTVGDVLKASTVGLRYDSNDQPVLVVFG